MSITFDHSTKTFYLDGKGLTYAFFINDGGYPSHLYFGAPITHDDIRFTLAGGSGSFVPTPAGNDDRKLSYMNHLFRK